jgi:hypothetical protein
MPASSLYARLVMTWALRVVGLLATLLGLIWIGQGLGYIGGSFMTGQSTWVRNGAITALAGLAIIYLGLRRR